MAIKNVIHEAEVGHSKPDIRKIGMADLKAALASGFADFNAQPTHLVFLAIIYPLLMIIFVRTYAGYDFLPLVLPILAGSTLLGPLAACGMYEMSRRREQGLDVSWIHWFDILRSPSIAAIAILGIVLGTLFLAWLVTAQAIYSYYFGDTVPESIRAFAGQIFTTPTGWGLIAVGCGTGFIFSVLVLIISVISFPLLIDKHVDPLTAVLTSVRSVFANPITMAVWGLIVAASLLIGALPLFVGLAVVMPVLGHATWHLYRRVVAF